MCSPSELQQVEDLDAPAQRNPGGGGAGPSRVERREGGAYLAKPFRQAFCMASMVYRRNSWASSWFPKRKCRAISAEGRGAHQMGGGAPAFFRHLHVYTHLPADPLSIADLCKGQ